MDPLGTLRHAVSEFREHYDDPVWRRKRLAHRIVAPVHDLYPGRGDAIDVMAEPWDNLLVLDACRADLFEEVADLDRFDSYRRVTSSASMTREWTRRQFADRQFGDTVYVTANPYTSQVAGNSFHDIVEVWADDFDEAVGTVRPDAVVDAARDARQEYPDKRLVVHFMQPHYPFLDHPDLTYDAWAPEKMREGEDRSGSRPRNVWQALELGHVTRDAVWDAYADNLEAVLDPALDLAADLGNRSVVTSDHGNMLGERAWPVPLRLYGHPLGVRSPELVEVPWAVIDGEQRKTTDDGVRVASVGEDVERRLRDLGYA